MTTSDQIHELAAALAKAQGEMGGALKESANPFFKSKYADLASVWEACRKPLAANGLAIVQSPTVTEGRVCLDTLLLHTSGQWIRNTLSCAVKDDSPQVIGSATTYLRRYALQSLVGVAAEDDDAEAAHGRGASRSLPQAAVRESIQVAAAPSGFQEWLSDLEAVVSEGTSALEQMWKRSKPDYRQYLTTSAPAKWAAMKKAAAEPTVLMSDL